MAAPPSPNQAFSIVNTARKLPVKRKSHTQTSSTPPAPTLTPTHHEAAAEDDDDDDDPPSPPDAAGRSGSYQYNRLWSESDEITFLRALVHSRSDGYRFPRDMPLFYDRFRASMAGSYTRTQFSEKLRRLKRKFRHVSGRVRRQGTAETLKTSHEKVVYELSHRLWGDVASGAAAEESDSKDGSDVEASAGLSRSTKANVVVRHEPTPAPPSSRPVLPPMASTPVPVVGGGDSHQEGGGRSEFDEAVGLVTAETMIGVLEESIKDARMVLVGRIDRTGETASHGPGRKGNLKVEWAEQQIAEFDVFSQRLRLVIQNSISNLRNREGCGMRV